MFSLIDYMRLLYNEAINENKEYAYLDGFTYYMKDDKFVLHHLKYKDIFELKIPDVFTYMDSGALIEYQNILELLDLGNIVEIEDYAFSGFRKLWRLEGRKVEKTGRHSLVGTKLNGLHLPELKSFYSNSFLYQCVNNNYYLDINMTHLDIGKYSASGLEDCRSLLFRIYSNYFKGRVDYKNYLHYTFEKLNERVIDVD